MADNRTSPPKRAATVRERSGCAGIGSASTGRQAAEHLAEGVDVLPPADGGIEAEQEEGGGEEDGAQVVVAQPAGAFERGEAARGPGEQLPAGDPGRALKQRLVDPAGGRLARGISHEPGGGEPASGLGADEVQPGRSALKVATLRPGAARSRVSSRALRICVCNCPAGAK